jgi:outer membrane receptor protein involved in Fe transport
MLRVAGAICLTGSVLVVSPLGAQAPVTVPAAPQQEGRITGRVLDAATGQPLANVEVTIPGTTLGGRSDLDGRYTIVRVPVGPRSVVARRIGRQPKRFDGVMVTAGEAAIVNFSLGEVTVELQSVVVSASAGDRSATGASLLAAQQRAASASDGVSAEQIKKTPDSNAGEAAARVSGVSIVDGKFLVARGLSERYSTTLLNGAEVASPEPTRKLVPLDVFPAGLLESIVVTKSATPDKPGDFSGGAVEIKTKEFPENTIRQISVSQGYNSQSTFQSLPFPKRSGLDYLGFDNGRRAPAFRAADSLLANPFVVERFAEGIRNTWNPSPARVLPKLGFGVTLGGQRASQKTPLGYVFSLTYSAAPEQQTDRFFGFYTSPDGGAERGYVYQDSKNTIDWGAVGNLSLRLGQYSKLSWKNLYTRNAEELYSVSEGFNIDLTGDLRQYQFQYVERNLIQSQLAGEHLLRFLNSSRLEWKASWGQSGRNEPDNRQVRYGRNEGTGDPFQLLRNNDAWVRTLDDQSRSAQVDWSVPLRFLWTDFNFKTGALARTKTRSFVGELFSFSPSFLTPLPNDLRILPPEKIFQPENLGTFILLDFPGTLSQPYDADDNLSAAYGMLDLFFGRRLRLVAGARIEDWRLDLYDGGRELFAQGDTTLQVTRRRNRDVLLSANATFALSDRANVRLAAFQSVSRPDTRELSRDEYREVAGTCSTIGNPNLQRGTVDNADARLEWYPRPGEVLSISGFYKRFTDPIIRVVDGRNNCTYGFANAESAENFGGELELRKDLTFLPGMFERLSASFNATLVRTSVVIAPRFGTYTPGLDLEGQSPYVLNAGLSYRSANDAFSASMLYNLFDDRIVRYGFASSGGANATQGPNIVERGRSSLDAKVQRAFGERLSVSLSAKNLTNQRIQFYQTVSTGDAPTGRATPGVSFDLGVSLAR